DNERLFRSVVDELGLIVGIDRTDRYSLDTGGHQVIDNPFLLRRCAFAWELKFNDYVVHIGIGFLNAFSCDRPIIRGVVCYEGKFDTAARSWSAAGHCTV